MRPGRISLPVRACVLVCVCVCEGVCVVVCTERHHMSAFSVYPGDYVTVLLEDGLVTRLYLWTFFLLFLNETFLKLQKFCVLKSFKS